jgi:hypothetical protein
MQIDLQVSGAGADALLSNLQALGFTAVGDQYDHEDVADSFFRRHLPGVCQQLLGADRVIGVSLHAVVECGEDTMLYAIETRLGTNELIGAMQGAIEAQEDVEDIIDAMNETEAD